MACCSSCGAACAASAASCAACGAVIAAAAAGARRDGQSGTLPQSNRMAVIVLGAAFVLVAILSMVLFSK